MGPEDVIRRRRVEKGLSLAELAERSQVSAAMLSEVERGLKSPTIRILSQIARGLECSVSELLGSEDSPAQMLQVIRSDERQKLVDPETGVERSVVAPLLMRHGIVVVWFRIPAGVHAGVFPAHRGGVLEHITVVRGSLEATIGATVTTLKAGDSMSYSAETAHGFRAVGRTDCEYLLVIDSSRVD
jgi:transcriptional regulator with XRE-family HTH domain